MDIHLEICQRVHFKKNDFHKVKDRHQGSSLSLILIQKNTRDSKQLKAIKSIFIFILWLITNKNALIFCLINLSLKY